MRALFLYIILQPLLFLTNPTAFDYKEIARVAVKANDITTDNLGNIYLLRKDELLKYNDQGVFLHSFSDKSLGTITNVDATNFLKILVFYRDFSKVVFLDNMLAPTNSPIHLQRLQLEQAVLAASSHNNGMWIFDQASFQAIRLDQNLKITHQTGNLMQLLNIPLNPNFILESNNMLYINNPQTGILVFDVYGTYYKTIPVTGLERFQVIEDEIFYLKNKQLQNYNLKTLEEAKVEIPEQTPLQIRFEKKRLYILSPGFLSIYAID